ncbi:hypothetical protein HG530_004208 [Fusarium avenaceum]|nr:hypothetical protein HG530_004208 [Fusarium avenaceum]
MWKNRHFVRLRHTSADNSRKLLLADAEKHTNGQVEDGNEGNGESSKEPEFDTDVLLGACAASPVSNTATSRLGAEAMAGEARVAALTIPALADTLARTVLGSLDTAFLRLEA